MHQPGADAVFAPGECPAAFPDGGEAVGAERGQTAIPQGVHAGFFRAGKQHDPVGFGSQYGYYTDTETGLLCLTHRYYDPGTGKFINRDPIGYQGGANLYGFADGNPVNESDPDGTQGYGTNQYPGLPGPEYVNPASGVYDGTAEENQEHPSTIAVLSGQVGKSHGAEAVPIAVKGLKNGRLAGGFHPKTKVPFGKTGYPVFVALFKSILPESLIGSNISDEVQFKSATAGLAEAMKIRPGISLRFNIKQTADILNGNARIDGLTWHHHEDGITLELVDRTIHAQTGHSGGRANTGGRTRSKRRK